MLHLRLTIFLFLTVLFTRIAIGQCELSLKGRVVDNHHDEGLEFATVFIEELNLASVATEDGTYKFNNLCLGKYHISISHVGCQSIRLFIDLSKDSIINFQLEHHSFLLEEVAVISESSKYGLSLNQSNINGEMLQSLQGQDLGQITSRVPGVNILTSGYTISKPMINGLTGNRIVLLNNGVPLESQQWGNDHAPEIDPFTAQSIKVIKGSAAVKYGINAMAGVIVTESAPIPDDPHPHVDLTSLFNSNGRKFVENIALQGSSKWTKYKLIGTYKKSGDLSTPSYLLANTGSKEYHLATHFTNNPQAKWYRSLYASTYNTKLGILRGAHISNTTDLEEAIQRTIPFFTSDTFTYRIGAPSQQVGHHMVKLENKVTLQNGRVLNLDVAAQQNIRREFDVRRGNQSNRPVLHLDLKSIWLDAAFTKIKESHKAQFGIQNKYVNNINIQGTGVSPILPNYVQNSISTYFSASKNFKAIDIEAGGRLEYQYLNSIAADIDGGNGYNQAYSIGLNYNSDKAFSSKINIGYINRQPFVNELYSNGLHQGLAAIEEGNRNLGKEQSLKYILESKWKISSHVNFTATAFYHQFSNYIYLAPSKELRLTIRGAYPVFQYNQVDANLLGADAMVSVEVQHKLELLGKISYNRGSIQGGLPLVFIPPGSAQFNINYLLQNLFSLKEVKIAGEMIHVAKQNRLVIGQDYTDSPPAYTLFNLGVTSKTKLFDKEVKFHIGVDNVFNSTYRNYLNRFRYFADELGRNIFLKINLNI
jgi:iron complex outermembrane recepter protein